MALGISERVKLLVRSCSEGFVVDGRGRCGAKTEYSIREAIQGRVDFLGSA